MLPGRTAFTGVARFAEERILALASAVLALSAFNIGYRLADGSITEWDESLYALSATEMIQSGDWVATRLLGHVDYFNIKPPLNVWMIAASFELFGTNALALRLPAAICAWLTVAVTLSWCRRAFGALPALIAALVLSTSFGFLFVHSGRTGNPDAPGTLLVVLTVLILDAARSTPYARAWLGPVLAAAFLLRGLGALLPLAIVVLFEGWRGRRRGRAEALSVAAALFVVIVAPWLAARWSIDGAAFLGRLWTGELARVMSPVEAHREPLLFYLDVLQKYQYEWLAAAAAALIGIAIGRGSFTRIPWLRARVDSDASALLVCWAAVTLLIPTAMQTKTSWYLHPFYPAFSVLVGLAISRVVVLPGAAAPRVRAAALAVTALAFVAAQSRVVLEANRRADQDHVHDLLTGAQSALAGHAVYTPRWTYADIFVLRDIVRAEAKTATTIDEFLSRSRPEDFLMADAASRHPGLQMVARGGERALYRRRRRLSALRSARARGVWTRPPAAC